MQLLIRLFENRNNDFLDHFICVIKTRKGGTKMNDKEKELEKIADQLLEKAAEMTSLANELYRLIGHVNNG